MDPSFPAAVVGRLLLLLILGPYPLQAAYCAESAQEMVAKADAIRFPQEDFQTDVTITSSGTDEEETIHRYQILSKGRDKTVVFTTYPPFERGQILLMKDRDLWAYMPNVSQPIRLSLAQRLTGQVANGDLTRANFSADYHATLMKKEMIDGRGYGVLELTAIDHSVTYHKVVYWVDLANFRPYKAEFYSASGRLMKTCLYSDFRKVAGRERPTRLVMLDALRHGEKSILQYSNMQAQEIPDKVFTKDYLKKLQ